MDALPVRLRYASAQAFVAGGISVSFTAISVKVKNIGFLKDVAVVFRKGSAWSEESLSWASPSQGDHDLFTHQIGEQIDECAIRYTVNGQTFWDNNGWQNFHFNQVNTVGGNVVLNQATAKRGTQAGGGFVFTTSWMEGEIYVNNLSFNKDVGIRFSADGGAHWEDSHANYAGSTTESNSIGGNGVEVWKFKTPEYNLNAAADQFRFAVFYRNGATGEMFWDNNFGQDYHVGKADGTQVK